MTPEAADAHVALAGVYIHIPFCARVCPYCDFAVVAGRDDLIRSYVDALVAQVESDRAWRPLDAIYIGGGTPSHVDPELLGEILAALERRHGWNAGAEVSLEANPEDFDVERASSLHGLGFNRVSFGAQSFDDGVLASLGRRHDPDFIDAAVSAARAAGFENVSLDLIYGTPGESDNSWLRSLRSALALEPDHLSCYALTVEAGTPLGRAVAGGASAPDPDAQADRYEAATDLIDLDRYEVSNWARPGKECRYNSILWAQGEFLAYGNGAHGFLENTRFRHVRRVDAYVKRVLAGVSTLAGEDRLEGWDLELDRLFVGLRRVVGVAEGPGTRSLLASPEGARLVDARVITVNDGRLAVARPLLTDAVGRAVMDLESPIVCP